MKRDYSRLPPVTPSGNRRMDRGSRHGVRRKTLAIGGGRRGNDGATSDVRKRSTDHEEATCLAEGPLELAHRRDPQARRALRRDGVGRRPGGPDPGRGGLQPGRPRHADSDCDGPLRPGPGRARLRSRGSRYSALLLRERRRGRRGGVSRGGGRVPAAGRSPRRHRGAGAVSRLRRLAGRDRRLRDATRERARGRPARLRTQVARRPCPRPSVRGCAAAG